MEVTMSKQTAVEWFIYKITDDHDKHFIDMYRAEIEYAYDMEREQMIDAILDNRNITSQVTLKDAELYYNETYGETKN